MLLLERRCYLYRVFNTIVSHNDLYFSLVLQYSMFPAPWLSHVCSCHMPDTK